MGVAEELALAAQQLSALEPMAGACLAINLAYLALDRFRYRREIEPYAEKICAQHDAVEKIEDFYDLDQLLELHWLAKRKSPSKDRVFKADTRGAIAYRFVYRNHADVLLAIGGVLTSAFTMVSGVALGIGRWTDLKFLGDTGYTGFLFYSCLILAIIPGIGVALGRKSVAWGISRADHCNKQIAISIQASARTVAAPT